MELPDIPVPNVEEGYVRALRDRVFEHKSSDTCWRHVRNTWMNVHQVKWLLEHDFPTAETHKHRP